MASHRRVVSMNFFAIVFLCCCAGGLAQDQPFENVRGRGDTRKMGAAFQNQDTRDFQRHERRIDTAAGQAQRNGYQGEGGQDQQRPSLRKQFPDQQKLRFQDNVRQNPNVGPNANRPFGNQNQNQPQFNQQQQQPPQQNAAPKRSTIKISEHPACLNDVKTLCAASAHNNNFAVLDCLQNDVKSEKDVSAKCHHFLWQYKSNLTKDMRFDAAASEVCKDDLKSITDCERLPRATGVVIPCLIEHKSNVSHASCKQFLTKMASIIFGDYRLLGTFIEKCQNDIERLQCGRLDNGDDNTPHSQGHTVECLSEHVRDLDKECKKQILRVAELQADDYHMDRPLFYACRDDRERFCSRTKAGSGKVYKCLYRHKFEREMSSACRAKLVRRQRLMQEDYKVNKGLAESCRQDIKQYHCLKGETPETKLGRLSHVVLCLEGVQREDQQVTPECIAELKDMRRSLMEDYKITPDIVSKCDAEIKEQCGGGLQREGKTLHCLMDLARHRKKTALDYGKPKTSLNHECKAALKTLLRTADAAEDYTLDRPLQEACQAVVETACKESKAGQGRVMNCLMDQIGKSSMTDECEERLIELQYFVSRDFKLDTRLFKYCQKDAIKQCSAQENWYAPHDTTPEQGPNIFACLYHHMKAFPKDADKQLTRACSFEVKRVMRQRAVNVDLEPRIEGPCMEDLAYYCSKNVQKGEEMKCLQDHYKDLENECRWAVGNFTEDIEGDISLDKIIMQACTPMIKKFCQDAMGKANTDAGEVMQCLIEHKNNAEMNRKCSISIEHHQLTTLKDYRFSFKFKEACKADVMKFCKGSRKKSDVVRCLSDINKNDTLLENEHRLSRPCRKQLRFELLQRGESINLDPELKQACDGDIAGFCPNVSPGESQVIECLRKKQTQLSPACRKKIFKREKVEIADQHADYMLMMACKRMIKIHCERARPFELTSCLTKHKDEVDFDTKCRKVILSREVVQAKDYRLNPVLRKSCKLDINKFCKAETANQTPDQSLEGKVINCLKVQFRRHMLSRDCEEHIRTQIKEAAMDYRQDPVLSHACDNEINTLCKAALSAAAEGESGQGRVEECLKEKMKNNLIKNDRCLKQIARVLAENKADIHVDPLLHRACALDVKHYCFDIPPGAGRQMSCLLAALYDKTVRLKTECRKMLEERVAMWEYAAKVAPPDTISELLTSVTSSQSRNYFLAVFCAVFGVIFIGGLFFGRVTKRVRAEHKDR